MKIRQKDNRFEWRQDGTFLPYYLVDKAHKEGWLRSLAFFVLLKGQQRNGVFYGYSSRGLKTGHSHTSVNRHINKLEEQGLLKRQAGRKGGTNLVLTGYKTLRKLFTGKMIFINGGTNSGDIYYTLLSQPVLRNAKSQYYRLKRKMSHSDRAKGNVVASVENYVSMGDNLVSKILGVSQSTSNKLKQKWSEQRHFEFNSVWETLYEGKSENEFLDLRRLGFIPRHAQYVRTLRRIVVRRSDSIGIVFNGIVPFTGERYFRLTNSKSTTNCL